jgi:indole-3-glycerol phosphate synthase
MGYLEDVIERKRREVEDRRRVLPPAALPPHPPRRRHAFVESLTREGVRIIAEVKRRSPREPELALDDDVVARVHAYREGGAAAISVLTDEVDFGGRLEDIEVIRAEVALPILRKDFLIDAYQLQEAASAGADAVLLIARALPGGQLAELLAVAREQGLEAMVEIHREDELARALEAKARVIGVNNRDLGTLEVDLGTCRRLIGSIPPGVVAVAESGIGSASQIHDLSKAGFKAFLVGTSLMKSKNIVGDLKGLQGFLF